MSKITKALVVSSVLLGLLGGVLGGFLSVKFLFPISSSDTEKVIEQHSYIEESSYIDAIKKVSPSVVSVIATKDLQVYYQNPFAPFDNDPFFKQFFNMPQGVPQAPESQKGPETKRERVGGGTGFIVSKEGLIITNKHVISDTEADYTVILNDGTEYKSEVVSIDPYNDLAVAKIILDSGTAKEFPIATFGDSDAIQVGQRVLAIGNALAEYENTVTAGIISAKGRQITAGGAGITESLTGLLQTDAAINPGNSGGPLVNLQGQVIGVNVAIAASANNIGFAIPINDVKPVFESVEKYGEIVRPILGVRHIILTEESAKELKINVTHGALLINGENLGEFAVIPGSPADKAGLKEKDVILKVDGKDVTSDDPLQEFIREHNPEDKINLEVWRGGEILNITVTLGKSTDFD